MESPAPLCEVLKKQAKIGSNGEASCFEIFASCPMIFVFCKKFVESPTDNMSGRYEFVLKRV